jgi:hypothetical protein
MEINKYTDIMGVVTTEQITEGRMVLLTSNPYAGSGTMFGSRKDLPGVKLPDTAAEAAVAKYCITWPVSNEWFSKREGISLVLPMPSFDWALRRGGWDQSANTPISSSTMYLTYPGHQESVVIPSGYLALAFDRGVFTVPSGQFSYSASLVPGAPLEVLNAADDTADEAGKLAYKSDGTIAVVERYDAETGSLTFRTL